MAETLEQRLARLLLAASAERGVVIWSHEQISRELGATRAAVTRALESFESAGLVALSRRCIEISKPVQLDHLARGKADESAASDPRGKSG